MTQLAEGITKAVNPWKLAPIIAQEIDIAATAYDGDRWESQNKALQFSVFAPSLEGKNFEDLAPDADMSFDFMLCHVHGEEGCYWASDDRWPILMLYHVDPEVVDGAYTGNVKIRMRDEDLPAYW